MKTIKSVVKARQTRVSGISFCIILIALAILTPAANAQITVGGNITFNILTGTAGSQPDPDSTPTTTLRYTRQAKICKITVTSTCPTQAFNLQVVATGVTYGVAAPAVTLISGMAPVDFITSIPNSGFTSSTVTLQYTASATFAQGNSAEMGNDKHTTTYTLQAQ